MRLWTVVTMTCFLTVHAAENPFWRSFKARGVNLGNWLILEEWMNPTYYANHTVTGADEWTFCQELGSSCEATLQAHWASWITEADITQLSTLGYNLLRIPIGHWGLIPTTVDEPYVHSTQLEHVERVMTYASTLGMQVVLDIHGLPGSQNGKDHSGHEGSINWFTNTNQARSLTAVMAAMTFIQASSNRHVIAALEVCNEPNVTTKGQMKTYTKYLKDSRAMVNRYNASMPLMFHDAFRGAPYWSKFTKKKKDNYVIDVHQYFSGFTSNTLSAVATMCEFSTAAQKVTAPVFVGEYSVSVGGVYLDTTHARQQMLETQVQHYQTGKLAGSAFWGIKAFNPDGVTQNNGWSVQALLNQSVVTNEIWNTENTLSCPSKTKS